MRHRIASTEAGRILAKTLALAVVLGTLVAFTMLSQVVCHASVRKIDCLDNQRATDQALTAYQADHDGRSPRSLDLLGINPQDRSAFLGRCPMNDSLRYYLDAASGRVICPNPTHRLGS